MIRKTRSSSVVFSIGTVLSAVGCSPSLYLAEQRAAALRAEIEELISDRTSTEDGQCAIVGLMGICEGETLVYSRVTVDEDVLLDKIRQYNDLQEFIASDPYHDPCFAYITPVFPDTPHTVARSENGVCVALFPGEDGGS